VSKNTPNTPPAAVNSPSAADDYLVEQLLAGTQQAWPLLVERYHGRLLAFARSRLNRRPEAEDLVQDTFVSLLTSLHRFDRRYSLETYLFTILRRKIIDFLRGAHLRTCSLQDTLAGDQDNPARPEPASEDPSASWYAASTEQTDLLKQQLATALDTVIDRLKASGSLRDMRILEMIFYAQLRNKAVADELGITERQVAGVKFRAMEDLRDVLAAANTAANISTDLTSLENTDSLLTSAWEVVRPTCPKRSTIGKYVLGTLEDPWQEFLDYHLNRLGCRLCQANYEDLKTANIDPPPRQLLDRILQSTLGFWSKTPQSPNS
jgi:RNA polymerase sigma factor (sigma-70 family)